MNVQVTEAPEVGEVWVQVTGDDPLPDWPTVQEKLPEKYASRDFAGVPVYQLHRFIPGSAVSGEGQEWDYEDWWILRKNPYVASSL